MKKLLYCAAALLAAISFSACSDSDDDGQNINASKLLGRWVALARYDYVAELESYVEINDKEDIDNFVLDFQDEKTVRIAFYSYSGIYDDDNFETFTYTLDGSKIRLTGEYGRKRSFTITRLTDTQLELWKKDIDDDYKVVYERKAAE